MSMTKTITILDDDGDEITFTVKGRCDGRGVHDHPAFSNGITSSEWAEDWDDDSREGYLAGRYDVKCEECGGLRVVAVADLAALPKEDREQIEAYWDQQSRYRATERAERMMGA